MSVDLKLIIPVHPLPPSALITNLSQNPSLCHLQHGVKASPHTHVLVYINIAMRARWLLVVLRPRVRAKPGTNSLFLT